MSRFLKSWQEEVNPHLTAFSVPTCDAFSLLMTENCFVAQVLGEGEWLTRKIAAFLPRRQSGVPGKWMEREVQEKQKEKKSHLPYSAENAENRKVTAIISPFHLLSYAPSEWALKPGMCKNSSHLSGPRKLVPGAESQQHKNPDVALAFDAFQISSAMHLLWCSLAYDLHCIRWSESSSKLTYGWWFNRVRSGFDLRLM